MGFFKTVKDVKAMGDHHGGMPSIRGSFSDLAKLADDRGERDILAGGEVAKAVIKGFPTPVQGDRFAMSILLEVQRAGQAPYDVDYVFPTTRMKAGLVVGMEVPIKVDPADPARIAVQWDAQVASIAAQGGEMAAAFNALGSTYSGSADAAMRQAMGTPAAAPAADADPAARLTKLSALRDAGAITDDEFAAKKAEILDAI